MNIIKTDLPEVFLIEPKLFQDSRGYFYEAFNKQALKRLLHIDQEFVQDNQSLSSRGVLRGLHYQIQNAQGKLVRVLSGEILDVAVDIRKNSPTFGQVATFNLSAQNKLMAWIPAGFAHGFHVLSQCAEVLYKTTDYYSPVHERSILWNDPALNIDWQIPEGLTPVVSPKDAQGKLLANAEIYES